jgi:type 1 glutamine amidotransferase
MTERLKERLLMIGMGILVASGTWLGNVQVQAGQTPNEVKIRVLLITGGHGFEHGPFLTLFESIPDVRVTEATYPDAADLFTTDLAKQYDVIVFYDMWGKPMSDAQRSGLVKLLNNGIGVVALHHTLAAHPDWPEYAKIIGGKYHLKPHTVDGTTAAGSAYDHDQDIQVHVAAANHPITYGLKDFEIHDETYRNYTTAADVKVLLTTDHPKSDRELAWAKTYGNSRVVYVELGHDRRAYENPSYRQIVARAIRYVAGRPTGAKMPAIELFNGKDLTGWKPEGNATWEVHDGQLVGKQGPDFAPGDLLTEKSYDDFQLTVTYRVVWPANTGVWFRYQAPQKAYQADVLEYKNPVAWSGTLYCPGKMFLAINDDPKLVDRDGWNTLVIRAVGNREIVLLNGTKVADVRDDTSRSGRIGFQVHAGTEFGEMRVFVRKVTLLPL